MNNFGVPTKTLSNGVEMPLLGYGVFQVPPQECERCVSDALAAGYRMIDTAQGYFNEEGVGTAVAKSGIPREDIFLVSKVWVSNVGEGKTAAAIDRMLGKLGTDYLDLLLLHQPLNDYYGAWRDMVAAYKAGKIRAIGVSNFDAVRLTDLAEFAEIAPMVNQVETHPFFLQRDLRAQMDKLGCAHMAWSPFAEGMNGLFANPVLTKIGAAHGKTAAQVALRELIQRDVIVIPKSSHAERMAENIDVFDFELTDDEMAQLAELDGGRNIVFDHTDLNHLAFIFSKGHEEI